MYHKNSTPYLKQSAYPKSTESLTGLFESFMSSTDIIVPTRISILSRISNVIASICISFPNQLRPLHFD